MITLDQVSEFTGVAMEELQFLNPSYKLDIIPFVKDKNYTLRLPRPVIGDFITNESQIYAFAQEEFDKREKPLPQFFEPDSKITYKVRSGDFLGSVARKYSVRVSDIKKWNGLRSNNIKIGQRLTIYPKNAQIAATNKVASSTKSIISSNTILYVVRSGDSLWSISQKFPGVSVQNIKDWNDISGTKLRTGMKLKISKG
jgi:membrane-bound lytic murein transglycosylase D